MTVTEVWSVRKFKTLTPKWSLYSVLCCLPPLHLLCNPHHQCYSVRQKTVLCLGRSSLKCPGVNKSQGWDAPLQLLHHFICCLFVYQFWGVNSGPHTCLASIPLLESHPSPFCFQFILQMEPHAQMVIFLLSSWYYRFAPSCTAVFLF